MSESNGEELLIMISECYRAKSGVWNMWASIEVNGTSQIIAEEAWEVDTLTDAVYQAAVWFLAVRAKRRAFQGLPAIREDTGWRQLPLTDDQHTN